jgi:ankyrin repeat protein
MHFNRHLFQLLVFLSIGISSLEAGTAQESRTLMATPKDTVLKSLANDIHSAATNDYIGIESPHLSHKLIKDELLQAAHRGAQVQIVTDTDSVLKLKKYFGRTPTNMKIIPMDKQHTKRAVINNGSENIVWFGSMNMSDDAGQNHDISIRSTDPNFYTLHYANQQQLDKPSTSQSELNFTSPQIIRSATKEAQAAKKKVISEFPTCATKPDDYFYFVAYSFDDQEIEKAILEIQKTSNKQMTLILDNKSWKNHRLRFAFLKPFVANGGTVYVFNKDQTKKTTSGKTKSMHIKAILRKCGETAILLMSTGNFTPQGKQNINYDLWQSISPKLADQFKGILDSIISESVKLTPEAFLSDPVLQEKTHKLLELMQYPSRIKDKKAEIIALIRDGADVNVKDDNEETPIIKAVTNNFPDITRELIDADANVNDTDKHQATALQIAVTKGFLPIVKMLVAAEADLDQSDKFGITPLGAALTAGNTDIAQLLVDHEADINKGTIPPIVVAVIKGNADFVQKLITAGARIDATDSEGFTALLRACESKNVALIAVLAKAKANLNVFNPKTGNTPLMDAFLNNNFDVFSALLAVGADLGAKNKSGQTIVDFIKIKKDLDAKMRALLMGTPFFKAHPDVLK